SERRRSAREILRRGGGLALRAAGFGECEGRRNSDRSEDAENSVVWASLACQAKSLKDARETNRLLKTVQVKSLQYVLGPGRPSYSNRIGGYHERFPLASGSNLGRYPGSIALFLPLLCRHCCEGPAAAGGQRGAREHNEFPDSGKLWPAHG